MATALSVAHLPLAAAEDDFASNYAKLRQQDRVIQAIGWKLVTGNAPFCKESAYTTGLLVQDAASYENSSAVRAVNGLTGDIFVQNVIVGSPADLAGMKEGAEITSIGDFPVSKFAFDPAQPWLRQQEINKHIVQVIFRDLHLRLRLAGSAEDAVIGLEKVCDSYFEVITGSRGASANGQRVAIGQDFEGFDYPEDELAAAVAHELAHNVVGHPSWLDRAGRTRRNIRETEREADRLMPWLLANAGYAPDAAVRFMNKWGPKHGGGLFRKRTHDGWDERVALIQAELPRVTASLAKHGNANWKADFERQFARD